MPETAQPYRTGRYITETDVDRAADALLRAGERPTVEKVRQHLGSGSPNTINPMLDAWWKRLASRLDSGPHALHRIPEAVAQITEALWLKALESARERARAEERKTRGQLDRDKREVDLRRHVLSLREAEFEDQLKERARTIATLEEQVAALTRLLQTEQANRASALRRVTALESSLRETEGRNARLFGRLTDTRSKTKAGTTAKPSRSPQRKKSSRAAKPAPPSRTKQRKSSTAGTRPGLRTLHVPRATERRRAVDVATSAARLGRSEPRKPSPQLQKPSRTAISAPQSRTKRRSPSASGVRHRRSGK